MPLPAKAWLAFQDNERASSGFRPKKQRLQHERKHRTHKSLQQLTLMLRNRDVRWSVHATWRLSENNPWLQRWSAHSRAASNMRWLTSVRSPTRLQPSLVMAGFPARTQLVASAVDKREGKKRRVPPLLVASKPRPWHCPACAAKEERPSLAFGAR